MAELRHLRATVGKWFKSPNGQKWQQEQGADVLCALCGGWNPPAWERCGWCGQGRAETIPSDAAVIEGAPR